MTVSAAAVLGLLSCTPLAAFVPQEYLPRARASDGISALSGGEKMYRHFMRERYMLDRIAAEGAEPAPSRPDDFRKPIAAKLGTCAK
jgi:hypothetical protein